jgi:uncharacterized 2Fe-2S/4Fe-4S cluster protein (DUF4445 family)
MSIELHFNYQKQIISAGSYLHEYAESFGIHVPTSCNRQGKCKECLVEVTEGMDLLSEFVEKEAHLRSSLVTGKNNFRLSCRTKIIAESGVIKCHTMHRGEMRIETKSFQLPIFSHNPDPAIARDKNNIYLDDIVIDQTDGLIYGLALDLGTTTIVLRLINLETGEIIATNSFENPQRFGGSEVMSRIHYDTANKGKLLQRTLAGYITHAIKDFPIDPKNIYEMVVAGNSTMRDLFFRLNVYSIGQNPYQSITEIEKVEHKRITTSLSESPKKLLLPINPKGRVYGMPIISGHVGADAAACMLAVNIANEDRLVAIMDIGTNTELILGNKNKILAASCPAGPAFEGGNITFGMPGLPGAVEKVQINSDGSIEIKIIGDTIPEGICGSGLIDLLSEFLKNGTMNYLGRFENGEDKIIVYKDNDSEIFISEKDINELAQAKGANVAGLHTVFNRYGVNFDDVDVFYLAGGFGRHLNIDSAKRIGLIPNIENSKMIQVGNAAIEGASIALLSKSKRYELEKLVEKVSHCRLETDPLFFEYFVEGCQFNPVESLNKTI